MPGRNDSEVALSSSKEDEEDAEDEETEVAAAAAKKRSKKQGSHEEGEGEQTQVGENSRIAGTGSKKKKKEKGILSLSFPTNRVKRLLKSEAPDLRTSSDAIFLFNRATELFLELFAEDAHACAVRKRKKSISYDHLSSVVSNKKRYEFLSDFVPEKLKAKDVLSAEG